VPCSTTVGVVAAPSLDDIALANSAAVGNVALARAKEAATATSLNKEGLVEAAQHH